MDTNWNGVDDSYEWIPTNDTNYNGVDDSYEWIPTNDTNYNGVDDSYEWIPTNDTNYNGVDDSYEWIPTNDTNYNGVDDSYEWAPTNDTNYNGVDDSYEWAPTNDTNYNGVDDSYEWIPTNDTNYNGVDDSLEMWNTPVATTLAPALDPIFGGFPTTDVSSSGALGEIAGILNTVDAVIADPVGAGSYLEQLGAVNGALAPIAGLLSTVNTVVADPIGTSGFLEQLGESNPALTQIEPLLGAVGQVLDDPLGVPEALAGVPGGSPTDQLWNFANQLTFNTQFAIAQPGLAAQLGSPQGTIANSVGNIVSQLQASGAWKPGANPAAALQAELFANKGHEIGLQLVGAPFESITSTLQQELNYQSQQAEWQAHELAANVDFLLRMNASRLGISA